jgi:hypothetical protein
MKRTLSLIVALTLALPLVGGAQGISRITPTNASGTVNAIDAGTCTTTSAGCVVIAPHGYRNIAVQVTGTCGTCTLSFEMSVDGVNWVAQNLTPTNSATPASSTTAAGVWVGSSGPGIFRARLSARASGSFVITIRATL